MVVSPFSSKLTPVGQVMQLLSTHTAGALLALPAAAYSGDLDTLATVAASGELTVTVSNLNAVGWKAYDLSLTLAGWKGATHGATTMLKAQGWAADSLFDVVNGTVAVSSGGVAKVVVPPFSLVRLVVAGK